MKMREIIAKQEQEILELKTQVNSLILQNQALLDLKSNASVKSISREEYANMEAAPAGNPPPFINELLEAFMEISGTGDLTMENKHED